MPFFPVASRKKSYGETRPEDLIGSGNHMRERVNSGVWLGMGEPDIAVEWVET